jgi:predicted transcriptional regulator
MNNPNESEDPARVCPRLPDLIVNRTAEVRDRLEELVDRLRAEGRSTEEISTLLASYVAAAMERTVPPSRSAHDSALGGSVVVNLTTVPLRFSVSAVMALYHLQAAGSQPARLGETIGISAAAMTGILDTLESRGLILRVRDPHDRRKVQVELTTEGRRMVASMFLN